MRTVIAGGYDVLLMVIILMLSFTVIYFARIPWIVFCRELFIDRLYRIDRSLAIKVMKLLNPCTIPYFLSCLCGLCCLHVLYKNQILHLVYRAIQGGIQFSSRGIMKRNLRNIYNAYIKLRKLVFCVGLISLALFISELTLPLYILKMYRTVIRVNVSSDDCALVVVGRVVNYVDAHLNNSYCKPEEIFELDNYLTWFDNIILSLEDFERAHIILYQGWGSCGQYAIVVEYLLRKLDFDTRIARFKKIDHAWAEIKINGVWYIVDPWYIGKYSESKYAPLLTSAYELASLSPFKNGGGVLVQYHNGTIVDAGKEHGY